MSEMDDMLGGIFGEAFKDAFKPKTDGEQAIEAIKRIGKACEMEKAKKER
jgi:hypothetical protein